MAADLGQRQLAASHHARHHACPLSRSPGTCASRDPRCSTTCRGTSCAPHAPKGLPENRVIYGHVLRNSLLPIVTAIGLEIGFLLGGSVIIGDHLRLARRRPRDRRGDRLQGLLCRAGRRHHAGADLRRRESDDRPDLHVDRSPHPLWKLIAEGRRSRCRAPDGRRPTSTARRRRRRESQFLPRLLRSKIAVASAIVLAAGRSSPRSPRR